MSYHQYHGPDAHSPVEHFYRPLSAGGTAAALGDIYALEDMIEVTALGDRARWWIPAHPVGPRRPAYWEARDRFIASGSDADYAEMLAAVTLDVPNMTDLTG